MKRQSDKKATKQVRVDSGLHKLLKMRAAQSEKTIREILESYLAELLEVENE